MQELEAKITSTWEGPALSFVEICLNFKLLYCGTSRIPSKLKELTQLLLKGQYVHTQCCDFFYSAAAYCIVRNYNGIKLSAAYVVLMCYLCYCVPQ